MSYYLPIDEARIAGFISSGRILAWCENAASSRIWIHITGSIFDESNHYTPGSSTLYYIQDRLLKPSVSYVQIITILDFTCLHLNPPKYFEPTWFSQILHDCLEPINERTLSTSLCSGLELNWLFWIQLIFSNPFCSQAWFSGDNLSILSLH